MARYNAKLSEQQKEYIGILGRFVGRSYLAKEFNVSATTIAKFKRRMRAEHIGNYKKRLVKAVETYQTNSDSYLKDKMVNFVFLPLAKDMVKYMGQGITLKPSDGYFRLYETIFSEGIETKKEIKEEELGMMVDELIKYIPTGKFSNGHKLVVNLENNLVEKLSQEVYKPLPEVLREKFDNVLLTTLNKREAKVLKLKFGLNCSSLSLQEIADMRGITRERVRQIEQNALKKLRYSTPSEKLKEIKDAYLRYLDYLKAPEEAHLMRKNLNDGLNKLVSQIESMSSADLKENLKGIIYSCRQQLENYCLSSNVEKSFNDSLLLGLVRYVDLLETKISPLVKEEEEKARKQEETKKVELTPELENKLSIPISDFVYDMELSVRSRCVLRESGMKTIGELVQKTEEEMLTYRNFGKKSLNEVNEVLAKIGLSLGMKL